MLLIIQVSQVQDPDGWANFAAKLLSGTTFEEVPNDGVVVVFVLSVAPGFEDWQAAHLVSVDLFCTKQESQLHVSAGGANFFSKSLSKLITGLDDSSVGLTPGLGVSQATHFVLLASLLSIHVSQDHDPAAGANFCIKSLLVAGGFFGAGL